METEEQTSTSLMTIFIYAVAIVVAYVLSAGPVAVSCRVWNLPLWIDSMVEVIYFPLSWLMNIPLLGEAITWYIGWWLKLFGMGYWK